MHNKTIAVLLIVVGISAITGCPNRGDHDRVLKPPSGAIVVAADVAPLSAVIALDMSDNNTCTQLLSTSTVPYPDLSIPNNSQISWRGAFKNPSPTTLTVQGITIEFAPRWKSKVPIKWPDYWSSGSDFHGLYRLLSVCECSAHRLGRQELRLLEFDDGWLWNITRRSARTTVAFDSKMRLLRRAVYPYLPLIIAL